MKRGIEVTLDVDRYGREFVRLEKARGKFTLDEIEDTLRYEDNGRYNGRYALILNCNGDYFDDYPFNKSQGDVVELYLLEDLGKCPVCGKMLPPVEFCPHCGKAWKGGEDE